MEKNFDQMNSFNELKNIALKKESARLIENVRAYETWAGSAGSSPSSKKFSARQHNMEHRNAVAQAERGQLTIETEYAPKLKFNYEKISGEELLTIQNVSVDYGSGALFRPLTIIVNSKKRIAVSGHNGCGKSSFLKSIVGLNEFSGMIRKSPGLKVSYLPQIDTEVFDTIDEMLDKCDIEKSIYYSVLAQLGFQSKNFTNRLVDLSRGQRKKVFLAKSLTEKANIYIWDEPLNYLDVTCREQLEDAIVSFNVPMILVEHDRQFIKNIGAETIFI